MKTLSSYIFVFIIIISSAADIHAGDLIAYPVPFDPLSQSLQLTYRPERGSGSVRVEIFDVNGARLMLREYSSVSDFRWKGYNDQGHTVSNGLYIIKTTWEDAATGKMSTDTARVTVRKRKP